MLLLVAVVVGLALVATAPRTATTPGGDPPVASAPSNTDTCLGFTIPTPTTLPHSSNSASCRALSDWLGDFYTGGYVATNGETVYGDCSCSDTLTGAVMDCRASCHRCWSARQLCTLQTTRYEWLSSLGGVSEISTHFIYTCGRDDRLDFVYPNRVREENNECSFSWNGQKCHACTEGQRRGGHHDYCYEMDCTNLRQGGYFNTCTGAYDFMDDDDESPFLEWFGAGFADEGRLDLDYFHACAGNVPFPRK